MSPLTASRNLPRSRCALWCRGYTPRVFSPFAAEYAAIGLSVNTHVEPLLIERPLLGPDAGAFERAHERAEHLFRIVVAWDRAHIVEPCDSTFANRLLRCRLRRQMQEVVPRRLIDERPGQLDVGHRARQRTDARHGDESAAVVRRGRHVTVSMHRGVFQRWDMASSAPRARREAGCSSAAS